MTVFGISKQGKTNVEEKSWKKVVRETRSADSAEKTDKAETIERRPVV